MRVYGRVYVRFAGWACQRHAIFCKYLIENHALPFVEAVRTPEMHHLAIRAGLAKGVPT